jgi:hypothetical protein
VICTSQWKVTFKSRSAAIAFQRSMRARVAATIAAHCSSVIRSGMSSGAIKPKARPRS